MDGIYYITFLDVVHPNCNSHTYLKLAKHVLFDHYEWFHYQSVDFTSDETTTSTRHYIERRCDAKIIRNNIRELCAELLKLPNKNTFRHFIAMLWGCSTRSTTNQYRTFFQLHFIDLWLVPYARYACSAPCPEQTHTHPLTLTRMSTYSKMSYSEDSFVCQVQETYHIFISVNYVALGKSWLNQSLACVNVCVV